MKLIVERLQLDPECTIGRLLVNGVFNCWTLEDTVRPPGVKVKGQTAIPYGTYKVDVTFSNRFQVLMPILLDVPMFEGIRIHPGNSAVDTDGCILVGRKRFSKFLGESRLAYAPLLALLQEAKARKEGVTIGIVNPADDL
jgi:hypothetical protein